MSIRNFLAKAPTFFSAQQRRADAVFSSNVLSVCEIISSRAAALNAYKQAYPFVDLQEANFISNPSSLLRLKNERVVLVSMSKSRILQDRYGLTTSEKPTEINPGMEEALSYLADELGTELISVPHKPDSMLLLRMLADYVQRTRLLINPSNMVVIDDTRPGIQAAKNALVWSILIIAFSRDLKFNTLSQAENIVLVAQRREALMRQHSQENLADFVVMFPSDLPLAMNEINRRLLQGELPGSRNTTIIKEGHLLPRAEISYNLTRLR